MEQDGHRLDGEVMGDTADSAINTSEMEHVLDGLTADDTGIVDQISK